VDREFLLEGFAPSGDPKRTTVTVMSSDWGRCQRIRECCQDFANHFIRSLAAGSFQEDSSRASPNKSPALSHASVTPSDVVTINPGVDLRVIYRELNVREEPYGEI